MTTLEDLPDSWEVWNAESNGRTVLVYRPDIFNSTDFPPECLPTIYVTQGSPDRPAGEVVNDRAPWYVVLYLEPQIRVRDRETSCETQTDAITAAVELASAFAGGDIDVRSQYQVPRDAYLDELESLTGRDA